MATTTNYGWTTPDDTDYVKDGASAIRSIGSAIDTSVKSLNPGTTAGDLDYYTSATSKTRIPIGSTNQVLTVTGGVPTWSNVQGAAYANVQVFTSSTTWTVPAGVTKCAYYVVGGGAGGGGGGVSVSSAGITGAGGGGGGQIIYDPFYAVTPGASITVTIGAGGAGGASITTIGGAPRRNIGATGNISSFDGNNAAAGNHNPTATNGGTGGSTTSNAIIEKTGGAGANNANSASFITLKSLFSQAGSLGGNGVTPTVGTVLGTGATATNAGFAGGGGGSQNITNSTTLGTAAGAGVGGGGAGGGSATSSTNITTTGGNGGAGAANTGGGGGGGGNAEKVGTTTTSVTSGAGGNGGSGVVVIFY